MIVQVPDVLNVEQVAHARRLLDGADWVDGRVTAGPQSARVKDNTQLAEEHPVARELGSLILSTLARLHHVRPVTRGARVASFFWIQSMVRSDEQRTLLFDLDTAIQRITADMFNHAGLVQLTAVYHKIVRRWADA